MGRLEDWLTSGSKRPGEFARPLVTLSYAQSIDGSIALKRGQPLALSGTESLKLTHQLRAAHAGVLVGIGTVLSDDPQLNVRLTTGTSPQVIILDSRLSIPLNAKVLAAKPRLFCTALAEAEMQTALEAAGAQVERQAANQTERVDLHEMLRRLAELSVDTLMVEGGGQIISSFLAAGLVDRVVITITQKYIGGYKAVDFSPHSQNKDLQFREMHTEQYGADLVVWGDLELA